MTTEAIWAPWEGPGLEHLRLETGGAGLLADGLVIGMDDGGRPFRLRYEVRCDPTWRIREIRADLLGGGEGRLHLLADGEGGWRTAEGAALPALAGCLDVDLTATPFTNTLPIRRLRLEVGEAAELAVAYVEVPSLRVSLDRQRYTRLRAPASPPPGEPPPGSTGAAPAAAGRYRFATLDERGTETFVADLPVDGAGLVLDYPGLFRRLWSG